MPVLNKIDLPAADPERVIQEIEEIIGIDASEALHVSAKTGIGIEDLLEQSGRTNSAARGRSAGAVAGLIIDSWFDNFVGVVALVRVMNGSLPRKQKIEMMSTGRSFLVDRVGTFTPKTQDCETLHCGEVGYVIAGIKEIEAARVGDTITLAGAPAEEPLPGFEAVTPARFRRALPGQLGRLRSISRRAGQAAPERCLAALRTRDLPGAGFGFRCGFLGMLHMEIIQERLEREYQLDLITTAPTVVYQIVDTQGEISEIHNPAQLDEIDVAGNSRTDYSCQYSGASTVCRRRDETVPGEAWCAEAYALRRASGADRLRAAIE